MQLMEREKFLEQPTGTVFGRFYPELMTASIGADQIQPNPFLDLCIKGTTEGDNFKFASVTNSVQSSGHEDHAERDHMALCYGATDCHFDLDFTSVQIDKPGAHNQSMVESDREFPPRQLYAVWSTEEVDALVEMLQNANKHARNSLGLEI